MGAGDRIKARLKALDVSQAWLAKEVGISQQSVNALVRNPSAGSKHLHAIAGALQTTTAYLLGETDEPDQPTPTLSIESTVSKLGLVMVTDLQASFALGGGMVLDEADNYRREVPFPRAWLRGASDLKRLFLIQGEGDSMEPTIADGDDILVDGARNEIDQQDRIWALSFGELGIVKRVRRMPDGRFQLNSDNAAVSTIEAVREDFNVLGRVIWVGRRV